MRALPRYLQSLSQQPHLGRWALAFFLLHSLIFVGILISGHGLEIIVSQDSEEYLRMAAYPLTHGIYSLDGIHSSGKREPGYSAFISLFMVLKMVKPHVITVANLWPIIVGQLLLYAYTSWAVARAATKLFGGLAGFITLLLIQASPICVWQHTLRNECLTTCLLGLLWCEMAVHWKAGAPWPSIVRGSLWMGIVCITRSVNFLFIPVLAVLAWWRLPMRLHKVVAFIFLALLPSMVWTYRNYQVFKLPIAGSIDGFSSLYRSNILPYQQISSPDSPEMPEYAQKALAGLDDAAKYQWFKKEALDWLKANPAQYAKQCVWRAAGMLIDLYRADDIPWYAYPFYLVIGNDQLFILLLLLVTFPLLLRRQDFWIESSLLFFLFSLGIYSAVYGVERYLHPALFLLAPVCGFALSSLAERWFIKR